MDLQKTIKQALELVRIEIITELIAQGHYATGELAKSVEVILSEANDEIHAEIYILERYLYVEYVTRNIPFGGNHKPLRNRAPIKSKYIQALIKFFEQKGASNPKSAAFATAYTQRKEGRPTRRSYQFSRTGSRTGFLSNALSDIEQRIYDQLGVYFYNLVNIIIET